MVKTKQNPHGGSSSHRPGGMATARLAGAEEEAEQQFATPQGKRKLRTAKNGQNMEKREQVQVSPQVKQVTNPSRWKEDQRYLPKKTHP